MWLRIILVSGRLCCVFLRKCGRRRNRSVLSRILLGILRSLTVFDGGNITQVEVGLKGGIGRIELFRVFGGLSSSRGFRAFGNG